MILVYVMIITSIWTLVLAYRYLHYAQRFWRKSQIWSQLCDNVSDWSKLTWYTVLVLPLESTSSVIAGVQWVTTQCQNNDRPAVASMSLGGYCWWWNECRSKRSILAGIMYLIAAGNTCNFYPASEPLAITVGFTVISSSGNTDYDVAPLSPTMVLVLIFGLLDPLSLAVVLMDLTCSQLSLEPRWLAPHDWSYCHFGWESLLSKPNKEWQQWLKVGLVDNERWCRFSQPVIV